MYDLLLPPVIKGLVKKMLLKRFLFDCQAFLQVWLGSHVIC